MLSKKSKRFFLITLCAFLAFACLSVIPVKDSHAAPADTILSVGDTRGIAYHDGYVYAASRTYDKITRTSLATGTVSDVVVFPEYTSVMTVALNAAGDLFYTLDSDIRIYKISATDIVNGTASQNDASAAYTAPGSGDRYLYGLTFDKVDNLIFIMNYFGPVFSEFASVYKIEPGQSEATEWISGFTTFLNGVAISSDGNAYLLTEYGSLFKNTPNNLVSEIPEIASSGLAFLPDGFLYASNMTSTIHKTTIANEPVTPTDPTDPPSSGSSTPTGPVTETVIADVEGGTQGKIAQTKITRTTKPDGTKSDFVSFSPDNAAETIAKLKDDGAKAVRIVIPDAKDEVSELRLELPAGTLRAISSSGLNLEIYTNNGIVTIPNGSLSGLSEDLYFHLVPIKKEDERQEVEARARKEQIVKNALGNEDVKVVGRPMSIETNMKSREVALTLPLDQSWLPSDPREQEAYLKDLGIFIEHSDGERKLVRPAIATLPGGRLGLSFTVLKFSTFTIVHADNLSEILLADGGSGAQGKHSAYMKGYADGSFKPEQAVSRSEIAAILYRLLQDRYADGKVIAFSDVASNFWASAEIRFAASNGLMIGYTDGSFKPNGDITRAEMAAMLARLAKLTGKTEASVVRFADVDGTWAAGAIAQAAQAGFMKGYPDGSFKPNQTVTRAEAVTIFNRVANRGPLQGVVTPSWKDVATGYWAFKDIEEASQDHAYEKMEDRTEQLVR
ncbi:S-layer homology domain-containing protein [Cohnella endophytica]|nr:S-layer homology domain-containing protein [Cohnella endophytica]